MTISLLLSEKNWDKKVDTNKNQYKKYLPSWTFTYQMGKT